MICPNCRVNLLENQVLYANQSDTVMGYVCPDCSYTLSHKQARAKIALEKFAATHPLKAQQTHYSKLEKVYASVEEWFFGSITHKDLAAIVAPYVTQTKKEESND